MREGEAVEKLCKNPYCTCGAGCGCGAGCQCGKPTEKLAENVAATVARASPVVMLQGAGVEKSENPCDNAYCTCGPNCGCGAGCQCGKPTEANKLAENVAATVARASPVVMVQGAGADVEDSQKGCGNSYCTCGPNSGCGAGCHCGKPTEANKLAENVAATVARASPVVMVQGAGAEVEDSQKGCGNSYCT